MSDIVAIGDDVLTAIIDVGRGAEVRQITDRVTGTDILMSTPWGESASRRRPVTLAHPASASEAHWMETYAGGWQTLFPHAGTPAVVDGSERHYHGEASSVPWVVDTTTGNSVTAHLDLFTVPVHIDRAISVEEGRITVTDTISNSSGTEVSYDYQSHPAFGAPFIEDGCFVSTDARVYTPFARYDLGEFAPGEPTNWPLARARSGIIDLAQLPGDSETCLRFGWMQDFTQKRITLTNPRLGLSAIIEWRDAARPFAWVWEEIHAQPGPPWFGRGYAVAFEPSTRTTDQSSPSSRPILPASGTATYATSITLKQESS